MAKLLFNFSQKTTTTLYPSVIVFHHFCWNKSHKVPPTSIYQATGWLSISSLAVQPLPKPPPSHKLTSDLIPRRPPRKPPWKSFIWVSLLSSRLRVWFGSMYLILCYFIYCFVCFLLLLVYFKFACHVFVEMLVKDSSYRYFVMSKEFLATISKLIILSASHRTFQRMVVLVITETNYSQYARTTAQSFFRSWMTSKTMDLKSLVILDHRWKELVWLLGYCFWSIVALLFSELYRCIVRMYPTILIVRSNLNLWVWGMSQLLIDCIIFCL